MTACRREIRALKYSRTMTYSQLPSNILARGVADACGHRAKHVGNPCLQANHMGDADCRSLETWMSQSIKSQSQQRRISYLELLPQLAKFLFRVHLGHQGPFQRFPIHVLHRKSAKASISLVLLPLLLLMFPKTRIRSAFRRGTAEVETHISEQDLMGFMFILPRRLGDYPSLPKS